MGNPYDIIVIGGGLMAQSFLKACQGLELKIAVVEAREPNPAGRTFALNPASKIFYQTLGCWPAEVTPILQIQVSEKGCLGKTRFHANDVALEALGYCVREADLFALLKDTRSLADWYCPADFQSMQVDNGVTVTLGDGTQLHSHLLVAADGSNSQVRQSLGIQVQKIAYQQTAIVTNVHCQQHHQYTAYERFTSHGPMALLPLAQSWMNCVYTVATAEADQVLAQSEDQFLQQLQLEFGFSLGKFLALSQRMHFPLSFSQMEEAVAPHCVFIGNAAQTLHPVAGQGLNLGLRDCAILAEVLAQRLQAGRSLWHATLLTQYTDWRRPHQQAIVRLTDTLAKWFLPQSAMLPKIRSLSLQLLDRAPLIKPYFTQIATGYSAKMPSLMCGRPLKENPWKT